MSGDFMSKNSDIEKNVEKVYRGESTGFLQPNLFEAVTSKLKGIYYQVYRPYIDCEKVIIYTSEEPKVRLFEIICYEKLLHREILGSLFGLNINDEVFGDIVIDDDRYYFYAIEEIGEFILNNYNMIGNKRISLREVDIHLLDKFKKKYLECNLVVSSLRIDNVISKIIGTNRDKTKNMIRDKLVVLNYEILANGSKIFRDGDIFSVKRFGKYKFIGIIKTTKKDNYVIRYHKYL